MSASPSRASMFDLAGEEAGAAPGLLNAGAVTAGALLEPRRGRGRIAAPRSRPLASDPKHEDEVSVVEVIRLVVLSVRRTLSSAARLHAEPGLVRCNSLFGGATCARDVEDHRPLAETVSALLLLQPSFPGGFCFGLRPLPLASYPAFASRDA